MLRIRHPAPGVVVTLATLLALMSASLALATPASDVCPEPNDTPETACFIGPGAPAGGALETPADRDAYKFNVDGGAAHAHIELSQLSEDDDLYLGRVGASEWLAFSLNRGNADEVIDLDLEPGAYWLRVGTQQDTVDPGASYLVSLALQALPTPVPTFTPSVPPAPGPTPPLPDCPQPAPIAGPLLCGLFPQAADGVGFTYNDAKSSTIRADFVDDENCRNSKPYGLRLAWNIVGTLGFAGWGVYWDLAPGARYNASGFQNLTFQVRGAAGGEQFMIGLKDTANVEVKVPSSNYVVVSATQWHPVTVPLARFVGANNVPVNVASLNNVNLGWDASHGRGSICISDLAFT